jgi:diguanylate cyclase (GGDEF)-like protein
MPTASLNLGTSVKLFKSRVTRHAVMGVLISVAALIVATMLSSSFQYGEISLESVLEAQKSNVVLWFLDAMPFVFAFWGQYVSSIMAYEAGALVMDQTDELRAQTTALEMKAMHEATHDSLTDLPNRVLFRDRLDQALRQIQRDKLKLGLLILDLDRFKEVNDTIGHHNGDRLLKQVAMRLRSVVRDSDTLARLGGDEFAVLVSSPKSKKDIKSVSEKILKALAPPFILDDLTLDVQASIGLVAAPEHGQDVDTLIQRADVAMYAAKQDRSTSYLVYSPKLDQYSPRRLTLMGELRLAVSQDELLLHYQPKVNAASGAVEGVEALLRWQHKKHGLMQPDEFIPLAEHTGLIKDVTLWVLKTGLNQLDAWHKNNLKVHMSVNISTLSLLDPDFPDVITGLLASYDIPAEYLILEITETSIMTDPERALDILLRLSRMGVGISIDDFGTGYSSLGYLKKMPACELKIDKSFVLDMLSNEQDAVIVNATVQLGHNLGLKVIAEGVETEEAASALRQTGCDLLQGYAIKRPKSADELTPWLRERIEKK